MGAGNNLKKILATRQMTIKELADLSGVPLNTLYSITKRDSQNIRSVVLNAISQALDVSPFDITIDTDALALDEKLFERIEIAFGYDAASMLYDFKELNQQGQDKVIDYINDLILIEKYVRVKK